LYKNAFFGQKYPYTESKGGEYMFQKNVWMIALGGIAIAVVAMIGALAAALTIRKQASKLRANMRSVSRGVYNFGTALQLLSGADAAEDDCEISTCC
jgi:hypothetical protein